MVVQMESMLFRKASGSNSSMHLVSLASSTISLSVLLQPCWKGGGLFNSSSKVEFEEMLADPMPRSCGIECGA